MDVGEKLSSSCKYDPSVKCNAEQGAFTPKDPSPIKATPKHPKDPSPTATPKDPSQGKGCGPMTPIGNLGHPPAGAALSPGPPDPLIQEYHGISADAVHTSDMDFTKIVGNIEADVPVKSTRIRVGRNIDGFGLSPGITKEQRLEMEGLMKIAFGKLEGDLAGTYYPLTGMEEDVRQQLVDDHFMFVTGDKNLKASGMERDWPEGRGIFHNQDKTFLTWVNEEDQLRIISMQAGGDVKGVFERLARGIKAVGDSVKASGDKDFMLDEKYGFIHSCPTNLGTGMRASVHVDLAGWTKEGLPALKARCEELQLQPRGTRGESGGQTGCTYDISNKHRLGYSEIELVQKMIDGVNTLWKEDKELQTKHGL